MPTKTPTTHPTALALITIAPADLGVRDQAREDATPDEQLIASIRQHGIIQPPVVELDPETGGHVIVTGHRRVGAAIVAGLSAITCILRPTPLDGEAVTLEQQIVENERRKQLSAKDLAAGYEKLALFGLRPEDIAAGLGEKPERVRAGLKINTSKAAAELVQAEPSIDFEQAAIIAEFDEHPKLQKTLIETATSRPENFSRDVANARTQREVDARVATIKELLHTDGVKVADVVSYQAEWWTGKGVSPSGGRSLTRLDIPVEEHTACPGHAAVIHCAQSHYLNEQPSQWILYVCTDWQANGHEAPTTRPGAPTLTAEEQEARDQLEREREQARAEWDAKQELITANTTARREWIHTHLTTGRLRPTAHHFDLQALALAAQTEGSDWAPVHLALTLITGEPHASDWRTSANDDEFVALATDAATPSLRVVLGQAFAALEDALTERFGVKYFTLLESLGYTLTDTDIEHRDAAINAEAEWLADQAGEPPTGDDADEDGDDE